MLGSSFHEIPGRKDRWCPNCQKVTMHDRNFGKKINYCTVCAYPYDAHKARPRSNGQTLGKPHQPAFKNICPYRGCGYWLPYACASPKHPTLTLLPILPISTIDDIISAPATEEVAA